MTDNPPAGGFRVLWIGDPNVLPADAKVVGRRRVRADPVRARRRARVVGGARAARRSVLAGMIASAASDSTVRLGHLLAPAGRALRRVRDPGRAQERPQSVATRSRSATRSPASSTSRSRASTTPASSTRTTRGSRCTRSCPPGDNGVADRRPRSAASRDPLRARRRDRRRLRPRRRAIGPGTLLWSEAANPNWIATARRAQPRATRRVRVDERVRARRRRARCACTTPAAALRMGARAVRSCSGSCCSSCGSRPAGRGSSPHCGRGDRRLPSAPAAPEPVRPGATSTRRCVREVATVPVRRDRRRAGRRRARRRARVERAPAPSTTPGATTAPSVAVVAQSSTVWFCPGLPPALPHAFGARDVREHRRQPRPTSS